MIELKERRQYGRIKAKMTVYVIYKIIQQGRDVLVEEQAISDDLSQGGLRLVLPKELAKDKRLDLKIFLFSDPIALPVKGKVIWSGQRKRLEITSGAEAKDGAEKTYWVGIQFIQVDHQTQERIIRVVKKNI